MRKGAIFLGAGVVVALLLVSPSATTAVEIFTDTPYDVRAMVQVNFSEVPAGVPNPQTLTLKGTALVRTFPLGDTDGDGKPDIETEIVSLDLSGTTPQGLGVNLNSSKSNRSRGGAEVFASARVLSISHVLERFSVDSFFDVFPELSMMEAGIQAASTDAYTTTEPIRITGKAKNISDLSGTYAARKSASVVLHDRVVGTLQVRAINLNSSKSN